MSVEGNSRVLDHQVSKAKLSKKNGEAKSDLTWKAFKMLPTAKKCQGRKGSSGWAFAPPQAIVQLLHIVP